MFGGYLGFSQRWQCNTITLTFLGISLTQSAVHVFFSGTILFTRTPSRTMVNGYNTIFCHRCFVQLD